jgi:glucosamine--fructose-6-phosphate aminotransferase (isomerizing)
LKDDDVAVINPDGFGVKHLSGEVSNPEVQEIQWDISQIEKKGFKHFMLKEIFEQPESLKTLLSGRLKKDLIKLTVDLPVSLKRIVIVACGTSWHSALIGKYLIERICEIPVEVDYASEFRYRDPLLSKNDLFIVISQSGETADSLAALQEAKLKGCKTLGIVNVVGSSISREVDSGIYLHAGPEIGVASTKSFTSQVTSLILLALFLKQEKGLKVHSGIIRGLEGLPGLIAESLNNKNNENIKRIAEEFRDSSNFLYLGRGINFPVALEGALKLKEVSYAHAEGYPAAEMKHGPIALIDENMPVVFVATKNKLSRKILSNMEEVKAREGRIIAIVNNASSVEGLADFVIVVPETLNELAPVVNVIPLQLLAYHIADLRGLDVDKPRNLAKSVTVE